MNWSDESNILDEVAISAVSSKKLLQAKCCDHPEVHIHAHTSGLAEKRGRGSVWVWCSKCGKFSHLDGVPFPKDWKNNPEVDFSKVTAVPVYLETVKQQVDRHMMEFVHQ